MANVSDNGTGVELASGVPVGPDVGEGEGEGTNVPVEATVAEAAGSRVGSGGGEPHATSVPITTTERATRTWKCVGKLPYPTTPQSTELMGGR